MPGGRMLKWAANLAYNVVGGFVMLLTMALTGLSRSEIRKARGFGMERDPVEEEAQREHKPSYDEMKDNRWPVDPKLKEYAQTANAACRSECKVKALAMAALAGAAAYKGLAAPIDAWTVGPIFAMAPRHGR